MRMSSRCMRATSLEVLLPAVAFLLCAPLAVQGQGEVPCLMCHADVSLFAGREDPSRYVVSQEEYGQSVHGQLGFSCTMCHQGVPFPHPEEMPAVQCGTCHGSIAGTFSSSLHGYALARGHTNAPSCVTCHGSHAIRRGSDPESRTYRSTIASTCAECHGEEGLRTADLVRLPRTAQSYAQSIHGERSAQGITAAATCTDCHGVHNLGSPADPTSSINHANVAQTCGRCHQDIYAEYDASIHGRALRAGINESPTCNNCHGEHLILSPSDPDASTFVSTQAETTCAACHDDPEMVSKYGLQGGVVGSYRDSYHGWATRGGYEAAASCSDCHTSHLILPAADSASTVSPANIVGTCGRCHEGANAEFATSYTHAATSYASNPLNHLVRRVYLVIIAVTIGGMALHNIIILSFYAIKRLKEAKGARGIRRFDSVQLVQHIVTLLSFWVLVFTGFALRFPDAWWVKGLSALGMTEPGRSTVHRIAGVLLVLVSTSHVLYVIWSRRGRDEFRAMIPSIQDLKNFVTNMKYYLRLVPSKSRSGRYDYTQKAEYWALVWGTGVMALTGAVLWFPALAVTWLPAISITIAQTIHYYEAWLATLAIVVWHFFFVFFYPAEYPMSWTWLTGKISERAVKEHHGRWYDEELASGGTELEPEEA